VKTLPGGGQQSRREGGSNGKTEDSRTHQEAEGFISIHPAVLETRGAGSKSHAIRTKTSEKSASQSSVSSETDTERRPRTGEDRRDRRTEDQEEPGERTSRSRSRRASERKENDGRQAERQSERRKPRGDNQP